MPDNMTATKELEPTDLLVYVGLKRYMNGITKQSYPSTTTVAKDTGLSRPTIAKSIKKLEDTGYIKTEKRVKKSTIYTFNDYKTFEPFSYEFLDKQDLSPLEKSWLLVSQQHSRKDTEGIGVISYSEAELAEKINMSKSTINKCISSLRAKGYLETVLERREEDGIFVQKKITNLAELGQAIIWKLKDHDEKINKNTEDIAELMKKMEKLEKTVAERDKTVEKQAEIIRSLMHDKKKEKDDNVIVM
jgi:biotin operon repressor